MKSPIAILLAVREDPRCQEAGKQIKNIDNNFKHWREMGPHCEKVNCSLNLSVNENGISDFNDVNEFSKYYLSSTVATTADPLCINIVIAWDLISIILNPSDYSSYNDIY